jgi:hypothetical protein
MPEYTNLPPELCHGCGSFAGHDERWGCLPDADRVVVFPPGLTQSTTEESDRGRPDIQQSTTRISRDRSVTGSGERSNQ